MRTGRRGKLAPDDPRPRVWTGEQLLDRMLEQAGFEAEDLRLSLQRVREALNATTPAVIRYDRSGKLIEKVEPIPDHSVRLRAAETIYDWLGFRSSRKLAETPPGPITLNVAIITGQPADQQPLEQPSALEPHHDATCQPAPDRGSIRIVSGPGPGHQNGHAGPGNPVPGRPG